MDGMSVCTHTVHSRIQGQLYTGYLLSLTGKRKKSYIYIYMEVYRQSDFLMSIQADGLRVSLTCGQAVSICLICMRTCTQIQNRQAILPIYMMKGQKTLLFLFFFKTNFFFSNNLPATHLFQYSYILPPYSTSTLLPIVNFLQSFGFKLCVSRAPVQLQHKQTKIEQCSSDTNATDGLV